MIRLVALKQIKTGCGSIEREQPFLADEHDAERYIREGFALPEHEYERAWSGRGYWHVQPEWKGQTVVILAGGPSLTREQVEIVMQVGSGNLDVRVIAINNAYELAPWADILYFCDDRWYEWHREEVQAFKGMRVTLENLKLQNEIEVRALRDYGVVGFAPRNDGVSNGRNSGYQALHLAAWLGAARVLLLGYDMRPIDGRQHWHEEHRVRTPANIFAGWISAFDSIASDLTRRGVEVINCSPGSALKAFPCMDLQAAFRGTLAPEPEPPPPDTTAASEPVHETGFFSSPADDEGYLPATWPGSPIVSPPLSE